MKLKLLFTFLLLILLQTNGFGAIITVATNKNWSDIGSKSTDSIIVKKDDALANDTANANCASPSILPPSACPSYTASINANGSVCNTTPPPSVNLKVTLVGGQSPYSVTFRNEITNVVTTVTNYTSGTNIGISVPAVTTPYTLVSVTDANGCQATISQAYTSILLYSIPATPTATIVDVACSSDAIGSIIMNNVYKPGSLKFNGVNTGQNVLTPIDSHVDFGTTLLSNRAQFTGEGWIKFDKTKYKNRMSLFGQNDVVEFGFEADNLRCWTANGGNVNYPLSSYPSDNAWHHIAVVANGTNLQFYIDGVSVVTGGTPITTNYGSNTNYTTKIGWGVMDEGGVGLVGEVFNLSFWNRALSSDEIVGLATGFTQYNSNQVGLLAGYSFNEGGGTTMSSVGSVAPAGTLKGATLPVWTDPSSYTWTSTPSGFNSAVRDLTGLSPKTYNLSINLKGCPKTTSFVVNATNVASTITTAATPAVVAAVCRNTISAQTTTMAYTATTGTPTSYRIDWNPAANTAGFVDDISDKTFAFASGGGTVTGINVPKSTANGTYSGTMTVKNANGCTATQSITLIVGSGTPSTPSAPTATAATNVGCSSFKANWNPVAGATGYFIDVSPVSNFGNFTLGGVQNQPVSGTSFDIIGLTAGQTYYYRVRANNSCANKTSVSSNTVNISVSVAVTNSILTQTICSGDSSAAVVLTSGVAGTTFNWTASAPSGIAGFTASGTGDLPAQTITNSGTAPGTVTYSITPNASGCTGATVNYTIVVNPTPKVSNTPLTQTICSGSSSTLVTLTSATAGASFTWTATATSGVFGFSTSGTDVIPALNISTSETTPGTVTYVVTPTANGCPGTASNYTILVNPTPIVTNTPLTQTICSGGSSTLVTLTSGVSGTTFVWTASATAGVSGFTTSGTSTIPVQAISTTGTTQGTVTYVITPTANGCPGTATNYTVLVDPLPTVSAGTKVCIGSTITLSPTTGGTWASSNANATVTNAGVVTGVTAGSATFTFTNTATGCSATTPSVTINALSTVSAGTKVCIGSTITLSPTTGGTWASSNANATVTNAGVVTGVTAGSATFTFTNTATGCSATTPSVTINALPTVSAGTKVCIGSTITLSPTTGGTWASSNANATVTNAGVVTGVTAGSATFTFTNTATGCSAITSSVTINPLPNNNITDGFVATTMCSGGSPELTYNAENNSAFTAPYIITYSNGTNQYTKEITTASAFSFTPQGASLTANTPYTLISISNGNSCTRTSSFGNDGANLIVRPIPTATISGTTSVCVGASSPIITFTNPQTVTIKVTYAINSDSQTIVVPPKSGAVNGTNSVTVSTVAAGSFVYSLNSVAYNDTPTCSNTITGQSATVTVNSLPVIAADPSDRTVCEEGDTSFSVTASGTGLSYQWQVNTNNGSGFSNLSNGGVYSNVTTATMNITAAATAMTNYQYLCVVSGTCTPAVTSNAAVLTVGADWGGISFNGGAYLTSNSTVYYCPSTVAEFSILPISGVTQYSWSFPAGWVILSGDKTNTITVKTGPVLANSGPVYVAPINNTFCPSYIKVTLSSVPPPPLIIDSKIDPTCAIPTGTIKAVLSPASGTSYTLIKINSIPEVVVAKNAIGEFTGLSGGTYVVTYQINSGCYSDRSDPVIIVPLVTKTWNGSWSPAGDPTINDYVIFNGVYTGSLGSVNACSCTVNSTAAVTIASGKVLIIENGLTVQAGGTLLFEDKASLIQKDKNATNLGDITYRRTATPIKDFDYVYWSSPVAEGQKLGALSPLSDKYWSFANDNWAKETINSTMITGKGYIVRVPRYVTSQTVNFFGKPNNGDVSIAAQGINKGNLIGNPYPSAIDAKKFMEDNVSLLTDTGAMLYFWTHVTARKINAGATALEYESDDYSYFNLTGGTGAVGSRPIPDGTIAAGQSFMVASKIGGFFKFTNLMRISAENKNGQFFKQTNTKKTAKDEKNRIWLNLSNAGGAFKQMLVGYVTGATNDMDKLYDGASLNGNAYVDFYSVMNSKKYTIQGRGLPFDETDEVPLGYKSTIAGTFQIGIDNVDGSMVNQAIYLEDKITNTIHDLKTGAYSFATAIGEFNDRFVLRYTNTSKLGTGDVETKGKGFFVSVRNREIKINSFDQTMSKVMVYDLKGSLLYEKNKVNMNEFIIDTLTAGNQFMIVMVQLEDGKWISEEIIFHD